MNRWMLNVEIWEVFNPSGQYVRWEVHVILKAFLPSIPPLLTGRMAVDSEEASLMELVWGKAMQLLWLGHRALLGLSPHLLDGNKVLI